MSNRLHRLGPFRPAMLAMALMIAIGVPVVACGPFFAPGILGGGDRTLLAAPTADIRVELSRLHPRQKPSEAARPPADHCNARDQTARADLADLRSALEGLNPDRSMSILAGYERCRDGLESEARESRSVTPRPEKMRRTFRLPAGLPAEFAAYFRASVSYHRGDLAAAEAGWERLLGMPAADRRYRTTWALFMLGKRHMKERPDRAIECFGQVRKAAAAGFVDTLGLAAASYGWQARVELDQGHLDEAIELYVTQMDTGDPTAALSLRDLSADLFKSGKLDQLRDLAGKETPRRVLTSYLLAKGGPFSYLEDAAWSKQVNQWLRILEESRLTSVPEADRLGWMAYQSGDFAGSQRWLARSGLSTPEAKWIQAKLLLRAGKSSEAVPLLAGSLRQIQPDQVWNSTIHNGMDGDCESVFSPWKRVRGELGSVLFARQDFVQALHNFLLAGYWEDAAYVAERVLTADELRQYADANWPSRPPQATGIGVEHGPGIRHLLARRLVRLGRWKEARPYFSTEVQDKLDCYVASIRRGHDRSLSSRDRARAFWMAAREDGLELLATELGPDGAVHYGSFDMGTAAGTVMPHPDSEQSLFARGPGLEARLKSSVPSPDKRFHYRYVACEHAWSAASLMPDQSDETAQVLYTAGCWLKDRDPQAADRFYKALVIRCGRTRLGRQADEARWFPKSAQQ